MQGLFRREETILLLAPAWEGRIAGAGGQKQNFMSDFLHKI
jgi:hypothetical protein